MNDLKWSGGRIDEIANAFSTVHMLLIVFKLSCSIYSKSMFHSHLKLQGTVDKTLKRHELTRPLATKEFVWFAVRIWLSYSIVLPSCPLLFYSIWWFHTKKFLLIFCAVGFSSVGFARYNSVQTFVWHFLVSTVYSAPLFAFLHSDLPFYIEASVDLLNSTRLRIVCILLFVTVKRRRNLLDMVIHTIHAVSPRGRTQTSRAR